MELLDLEVNITLKITPGIFGKKVARSLALYPGVPSLIPGTSSLSDETLSCSSCLHMTLAVGGMLNANSLFEKKEDTTQFGANIMNFLLVEIKVNRDCTLTR